ncbi:MAG TPA: hypothetical protein VE987_08305 [Polyangiaceae bacterium]|nr:hypothetical protein [Polyangiaceae bacterium]
MHVFCPRLARSVELVSCERCIHAGSVSTSTVECSPVIEAPRVGPDSPVGVVSPVAFTCARVDVPAKTIVSILPQEPWVLPVVDLEDQFVGFASHGRVGVLLPPRLALELPVSELLFGSALAVPEGRSLRWAVHSMALHRTRVVAILDDAGALRGVLTDIDALTAMKRASVTRPAPYAPPPR